MSSNEIIGKRLDGRYELNELCGSGGMANVYKATDLMSGRTVAVKILKDEFLNNTELVRRFKNESKAISLLNHDNIVKVFDVSVSDSIQYIVMEFLEGISLSEYIERNDGKLKWKIAVFFTEQILSALSHAHEKGVVHRDIKPQNIMLMQDGNLKVMDFGIARLSRSDSRTMTEKAIGSVHYISPEQAKGDTTDPKADIYSVGIMLYEMLTGMLPFEADSAVSVAIKQISDTAISPRDIDPEIPQALEEITMRAMSKEPRDRYSSAAVMRADLEEFKRNPSIKFEYTYLSGDDSQTKYIDKVTQKSNVKKQSVRERVEARKAPKKNITVFGIVIPMMLGLAMAFAIGGAVLVFIIFNLSGNPLFSNYADVDLPTFIGANYDEVKGNHNFNFLVEEVYSNEYAAGYIVNQYPKPPKTVKENAEITLQVSKGVEIVTVPQEVLSQRRNDAERMLMELGLLVNVELREDESEQVPFGYVMNVSPSPGTQLSSGSSVTLYVSTMSVDGNVIVPDVVNMIYEEAQILLDNELLIISVVSQVESDLPPGTIISQTPEAGTELGRNNIVNVVTAIPRVVVAPAAGEAIIPSIVGLVPASAQASYPHIQMNYDDDFDLPGGVAGTICTQIPGAGTAGSVLAYGVYTG